MIRAPQVPVESGSSLARTTDTPHFRVTYGRFPAHGRIPPHAHDRTCVAIMLRGAFDTRFSGRPHLDCAAGSLAVEPIGETHCNCIGNVDAEVVVIQPDPAAAEFLEPVAAFLDGIRQVRFGGLEAAAERLVRELASPDEFTSLAIDSLALEILARAARATGRQPRHATTWMFRLEERLRAHAGPPPSLASLATECGVHPAYLSKAFRARHGMTIGTFLRRNRIDRAARLLVESQLPIAEIAAITGFADQSHLTRTFSEQMGTTPHRWRHIRRVRATVPSTSERSGSPR